MQPGSEIADWWPSRFPCQASYQLGGDEQPMKRSAGNFNPEIPADILGFQFNALERV